MHNVVFAKVPNEDTTIIQWHTSPSTGYALNAGLFGIQFCYLENGEWKIAWTDDHRGAKTILTPISYSIDVPANGYTYKDIDLTIPAGYKIGGLSLYTSESRNAVMQSVILSSAKKATVQAMSSHGNALIVAGNINVLCYK